MEKPTDTPERDQDLALAVLEHQGVIRKGRGMLPPDFFSEPLPRIGKEGEKTPLDQLLEDRGRGNGRP